MHEIRFCKIEEYDLLISFIDNFWKKDHIFTKDKILLDWQHLSKEEDRYNFVVAYNNKTKEFDAILGFIPSYQYDKALKENKEIWLAIWKIKESMTSKISGIQLLFYINSKLKPSSICSVGITQEVQGIYDAFKYKRDTLDHFYITSTVYEKNISDIQNKIDCNDEQESYQIKEISFEKNKDLLQNIILKTDAKFGKSTTYIHNRFIKHPTYNYIIYGIFHEDILKSFFIARKIIINEHIVIRIVDYYGEFIGTNLCTEFQNILNQESAEYIDFLCYLPNNTVLTQMGFMQKTENDMIPEYFEPLVQKNVTIEFAYKSKSEICIFKADSDQDRPTQKISEFK